MLELKKSQQLTPQLLRAELRTAQRIAANLTSPKDCQAVERYIMELEQELEALDGRYRAIAAE